MSCNDKEKLINKGCLVWSENLVTQQLKNLNEDNGNSYTLSQLTKNQKTKIDANP